MVMGSRVKLKPRNTRENVQKNTFIGAESIIMLVVFSLLICALMIVGVVVVVLNFNPTRGCAVWAPPIQIVGASCGHYP